MGIYDADCDCVRQAISHIKDEDKAGKLCAAIRAQLTAWGKAMEGTA